MRLFTLCVLKTYKVRTQFMYRGPTKASQDTTVATPVGDEMNAPSSPLLPPKNQRATIGEISVGAVGSRA